MVAERETKRERERERERERSTDGMKSDKSSERWRESL
jgi:hypothetical protein